MACLLAKYLYTRIALARVSKENENILFPNDMNGLLWSSATILLAGALTYLTWTDLKSHRLPDVVTLPLICCGLILSTTGGAPQLVSSVLGGAIGFGLFALIGQIYFLRNGREGLGLGDAKLFAAAGTWLGWSSLPAALLVSAGGALVFALATRRGTAHLPFGPWISLGFFLVWMKQSLSAGMF